MARFAALSTLAWLVTLPASASPEMEALVPCFETAVADGAPRSCITCHTATNASGCPGSACLDVFGTAFAANGSVWSATLASLDSDGDGWTNGEELGDPLGAWASDAPRPAVCACASDPGLPTATPADDDADGDGYCCRGSDGDANGSCVGIGEHDASFDCDDAVASVSSGAPELCTNVEDDDCDGLATFVDPECASVVDRDRDGFCPIGRDLDGDRSCLDSGEATADADCDDTRAAVSPSAVELCLGGLDEDCDGEVDAADTLDCAPDADVDGDGYCPLGRDANDDGDCLDPGETAIGYDCDDADPLAYADATESCAGGRDEDCDGLGDLLDSDCTIYIDADDDGFCLIGQDHDDDGSCVDPGEDVTPADCDDARRDVHPGYPEDCGNGIDDDCDGTRDREDVECSCVTDGDCDDRDPCTSDVCGTDRECSHVRACDAGVPIDAAVELDAATADAGTLDGGAPDADFDADFDAAATRDASAAIDAGTVGPATAGCGCRAQSTGTSLAPFVFALVVLARSRAQRQRRVR